MKILAMDSSGAVASVAMLEDNVLIGEITLNHKLTHSQTLLPMIDRLFEMTETDPATLDCLAIAGGPGSFTGLRIGAATIKGLAMVYDKPIVSVPTVDALAYHYVGCQDLICPIMDARRGQVYGGIYSFAQERLVVHAQQECVALQSLIERLNALGRRVIFLGDGVEANLERLAGGLEVEYFLAPASMSKQRAASVAMLAAQYFAEGRLTDAVSFAPEYLRKSQAEREREEKQGK